MSESSDSDYYSDSSSDSWLEYSESCFTNYDRKNRVKLINDKNLQDKIWDGANAPR